MDSPIELAEAKVLRLQPGDIVVFETDTHLSCEQAQRLIDQAKAKIPGHEVLLLSGGVSMTSRAPDETLDCLAESLWPRIRRLALKSGRHATGVGLA